MNVSASYIKQSHTFYEGKNDRLVKIPSLHLPLSLHKEQSLHSPHSEGISCQENVEMKVQKHKQSSLFFKASNSYSYSLKDRYSTEQQKSTSSHFKHRPQRLLPDESISNLLSRSLESQQLAYKDFLKKQEVTRSFGVMFAQPNINKRSTEEESRKKTLRKFLISNPTSITFSEQSEINDSTRHCSNNTDNKQQILTMNSIKKGIILSKDLWSQSYSNKLFKICGLKTMQDQKETEKRIIGAKDSIQRVHKHLVEFLSKPEQNDPSSEGQLNSINHLRDEFLNTYIQKQQHIQDSPPLKSVNNWDQNSQKESSYFFLKHLRKKQEECQKKVHQQIRGDKTVRTQINGQLNASTGYIQKFYKIKNQSTYSHQQPSLLSQCELIEFQKQAQKIIFNCKSIQEDNHRIKVNCEVLQQKNA